MVGPSRVSGGAGGAGLDIIPLTDWWHQPTIANALNLTNDQFRALDKIASDSGDEVSRLEREGILALTMARL